MQRSAKERRDMRTRTGWLMALALALVPATARAQVTNYNYEVPPSPYLFPGPFGHARMEEGGFFVGVDFVFWHVPNPLLPQAVASRGFMDFDGSIGGQGPGLFIGSGEEALNTRQVSGPGLWSPGLQIVAGRRFRKRGDHTRQRDPPPPVP